MQFLGDGMGTRLNRENMKYLQHSVNIASRREKIGDILIDVDNWRQ